MTTTTPPRWTPEPVDIPDVDLSIRRPADGKALLAALAVGLVFNLMARSGGPNTLAGALTVIAAASALLATRRVAHPHATAVAAVAAVFGACLAYRASEWLVIPNALVACGLLVLAASLGSDGRTASLLDLSVPRLAARAGASVFHVLAAPEFLAAVRPRRSPSAAAVRSAVLMVTIVVVFGALLASADAVFASLFSMPTTAEDAFVHIVLVTAGTWLGAGLLRTASAGNPLPRANGASISRTEANAVLGTIVALFSAFAVVQLVAAAGGARHVLEREGLTYAEYARSGYFQLLAVAALTAAILLALRSLTPMKGATLVLAEAAVALIIVIVGVALYRLDLYDDAFGLTMLRLYCQVFAVWLALVFALIGAAVGGYAAHRHWLPTAAAGLGLVMLLGLNVANPEAMVVRRNVARDKVDTAYLTTLSEDAVPAMADAGIPRVECPVRKNTGWASATWSRHQADTVRKRLGVCQP